VIVLDASAAADLILGTPPASAAIAQTLRDHDGDGHAPHLLDAEVGQVLRRFVLLGQLTPARAIRALERLADLPLIRYPHGPFLLRAFQLRRNATVYDGLYLALAEALGAQLITRDAALGSVPGLRAAVTVIDGSS
jgi:predicted nucleic acid-binding protein